MNHQRNNGGSPVCGAVDGRLVRDRAKVDCLDCLALPVPKMGRPRRGEQAGRPLTIKVTDDERQRWTDAAGDLSLSEWVRLVCNRNARDRRVL